MQLSWRCARLPPDQNLCSLQNIHHAASTITTNTSHSNTANPSALPVLLRPLDASHLCLEVSRHLLYLNTWRRQELFSIYFLFKHKSVVFSLFLYTSSDSRQYKAFFYVPLERRWIILVTLWCWLTQSHLFRSYHVPIRVISGKVETSCNFRFCHSLWSSDVSSSVSTSHIWKRSLCQ